MYSVTLRLIQKFLTEWVHETVIQKLDRDLQRGFMEISMYLVTVRLIQYLFFFLKGSMEIFIYL